MNILWLRRDLRLNDNSALNRAVSISGEILPVFIFDTNIIDELKKDDPRISFIHEKLSEINKELKALGSGILILKGDPLAVLGQLLKKYTIENVFCNRDYEPYARQRDNAVKLMLEKQCVGFQSVKDQVVFEPDEIVKSDGLPYTVYTPYKNLWLKKFDQNSLIVKEENEVPNYYKSNFTFPSLKELGFLISGLKVSPFDLSVVSSYKDQRNIPHLDATSHLGPHLRFGTLGIRSLVKSVINDSEHEVFLSELIWREFFIQILYHFPFVVHKNFRSKYDGIQWRNNEKDFKRWCDGETGYPFVDAGMRQLNQTGYMHNRVRMITAGFLCKHLLIDWKWGEAYFAEKLLDYELSSNNGNWQWAAGTGCDAAPYFRIFNPTEQIKKFDPDLLYIKKWVPEVESAAYPEPMVEHKFARERALDRYKTGMRNF